MAKDLDPIEGDEPKPYIVEQQGRDAHGAITWILVDRFDSEEEAFKEAHRNLGRRCRVMHKGRILR